MNGGEGEFAELALEVFEYQYSANEPYRRYCAAVGKTPASVEGWLEIPAVPTDVFKLQGVAMRCFPEADASGYFLTSGTTRDVRGRREWCDLELYEASVLGAWRELGLPEIGHAFLFSQRGADAPHSSLVRMFEILAPNGEWLIDGAGKLCMDGFCPEGVVSIFGTSLALMEVIKVEGDFQLHDGSWIFETGGSKGARTGFAPWEVRERLSEGFGVSPSRVMNEYSMTELFSQFYKVGDQSTHRGPSWTGVRVRDLRTGELAANGEIGYLEIVDLANFETVIAIQTQDLARKCGDREFELLGRDPTAAPRGCSRGFEDLRGSSTSR